MKLIWRLLYRFYRISSSVRYWAQRRFTRPGLAVVAGLIIAAMMGPDTENTAAYQAFALLSALLLVAMIFASSFRARFSAQRILPRFGTVGAPLLYTVLLRNLSSKPQSGLTLLDSLDDVRPTFETWLAVRMADERHARSFRFSERRRFNPFKLATLKEAALPVLPPRQEVGIPVELKPLRRGILHFTGITLGRADPLGLFRAFSRMALPQTTLILPKRYLLPPIALPGSMKYQQGGVALASNVGQSDEFVALRDYRHGDPPRHIHWRSWAKTGKPVVKEFEDEFFVRHALVLDTFVDHPCSEVFEEAISVAASFACSVRTQESLLDLLFVGPQSYSFTAGRGLARADQMLEVLASVRACNDRPFEALEHLVINHVRQVSGCICVLAGWDEKRRKFVEKMQALAVPLLVLVITAPGKGRALAASPLRAPDRFYALEVGRVEQGLARLK
jgi:uncharacterized protein (DUF58 family)